MRQSRSDEAIRLGSQGENEARRKGIDWTLLRAIYMRVLGLAWLAKGLYGGAVLIGLFGPTFATLDSTQQAGSAFSAIGDCVAGVGLWLTVDWGAITWIAVVLVEMAFAFSAGAATLPALAMLGPVIAYGALAMLSARQVYDRN
jgi:hypothetical protein